MKFLELKSVIQTNELLKRYTEMFRGATIEFEVYSCKKTREERKNKAVSAPLCFFINALEMAFEEGFFQDIKLTDFIKVKPSKFFNDLSYVLLVDSKNTNDAIEYINYIKMLLKPTIGISNANIFDVSINKTHDSSVYLIYNSKMKRILIVKTHSG